MTLNLELLKICARWQVSRRPEQPYIIRRGMAKQSGSIAHSWACQARWTMIKSASGQSMLLHWCMPIIVPNTLLLDTPPIFLFGRCPRLPIDLTLGVNFDNGYTQPYTTYAENLPVRLQRCHKLARENARKKAESNKKRYDVGPFPGVLLPGDCVLVRNLSPRGNNKLKDRWEDVQYEVLQRISGLPVYVVQQEGTGKRRTLHRQLLLPYHIPHEKEPLKQTPSQRVHHRLHHPRIDHSTSDHNTSECEADITLTTLGTTFNPSASALVPATGAGCLRRVHLQKKIEPSAHSTDEVAAVHPQGSHPSCDRAVDLHENHPPELARQTRSGRTSRPPNRLICDSVSFQKAAALLSLVTPAK